MATQNRPLRPFQIKVRALLKAGKNVILQAPTGSGKTRAAISLFIENLAANGDILPSQCLYATPLRVLSTQFYDEYQTVIAHINRKSTVDYQRRYEHLDVSPVSLQTGEQPDDPQFESLLTFCTIDQLLASFLGAPFGIGRSRANINVAAVLSSFLILDEYHLYPLKGHGESCFGARTTVLAMLSLLKGITPFVLMTATLSTSLVKELETLLNARVVLVNDEDELTLLAQGRQRFFSVAQTPMTAEAILTQHDQCSLVICNTVLRAQLQYWQLQELARQQGREIELILLHSRLTEEDRNQRSQSVMAALGPHSWEDDGHYSGKDIIVVATQVVEVGLDISVQALHTEIAPANSLIQRAGRCARYAQQSGQVFVYELAPVEEGKSVSFLPYDAHLCTRTLDELKMLDPARPVGFREEQALIDAVHTAEDQALLDSFKKRQSFIKERILANLKEHSTSTTIELIRDVVQVQMLIHDHPESVIKERPWQWQSFSLHPQSLAKHLHNLEPLRDQLDQHWCREAYASKADQADPEADSQQIVQYDWPVIPYTSDLKALEKKLRETIIVAMPQQLATYHSQLGLIFRDDWSTLSWPDYQSTLLSDKKYRKRNFKPIKRQSYQQHIGGLVSAYNQDIVFHLNYAMKKLEQLLAYPSDSIDHATRLAIACHDLGKLSIDWQQWAYRWQLWLHQHKNWQPYQQAPDFFFAKTDYDSHDSEQRKGQSAMRPRRPHHACESVAIGLPLIGQSLGYSRDDVSREALLRALCGAIARHHTATAHEYIDVQLSPGAHIAIREALEITRQNKPWSYDPDKIRTTPIKAGNLLPPNGGRHFLTEPQPGKSQQLETWLYFIIVRALRLSDQRADSSNER